MMMMMMKTRIIAKFLRTDLVICSHSRKGKNPSYSQINTVYGNFSHFSAIKKNIYILDLCILENFKNY